MTECLPNVMCNLSPVIQHMSFKKKLTFLFEKKRLSVGADWWIVCYQRGVPCLVKKPGVAGATLQTALSLIHQLIHSFSHLFPPNLQNIITPKPIKLES